MILLRPYQLGAYYLTLLLFGLIGLLFNIGCMAAGLLPDNERRERRFQRRTHRMFAIFLAWTRFLRLMEVRYEGMEGIHTGGCILVANHPGLMDITYLLARIPEAISVFKPPIRSNPILGAGARRAGYICNDGGHELVRRAAEKAAAGNTIIIFPEGTRTPPGVPVGPFRPGFVIIAQRARVPIQLVRIDWDTNVLVKGRAWWKLPRLPGLITVTAGPILSIDPAESPGEVAARIESWFRDGPPEGAPRA